MKTDLGKRTLLWVFGVIATLSAAVVAILFIILVVIDYRSPFTPATAKPVDMLVYGVLRVMALSGNDLAHVRSIQLDWTMEVAHSNFEDGVGFMHREPKWDKRAVDYLMALAKTNSPDTYMKTIVMDLGPIEVLEYYAANGYARAYQLAGHLYHQRYLNSKDESDKRKAVANLETAKEKGVPDGSQLYYSLKGDKDLTVARITQSMKYLVGSGAPQDFKKSFEGFTSADAEISELAKTNPSPAIRYRGFIHPQLSQEDIRFLLALHYANGFGVGKDVQKARALIQEKHDCGTYFNEMLYSPEGLEILVDYDFFCCCRQPTTVVGSTQEQQNENRAKRMQAAIRDAEAGHEWGYFEVASQLFKGAKDEEAIKWLRKGEVKGSKPSLWILGDLHVLGNQFPKDAKKSFELIQKSNLNPRILSVMYAIGFGTPRNYEKSLEEMEKDIGDRNLQLGRFWRPSSDFASIQKAAVKGTGWSQGSLGFLFAQGIETKQDLDQAIHWYEKLLQSNDPFAVPVKEHVRILLGFIYLRDEKKDYQKAMQIWDQVIQSEDLIAALEARAATNILSKMMAQK